MGVREIDRFLEQWEINDRDLLTLAQGRFPPQT